MKNYLRFLLTLLLAVIFWFTYNLSQPYSDLVNVMVSAESNIEGRSSMSSSEVPLCARVNTSGFNLLSFNLRGRKAISFMVEPEDFEYRRRDDVYCLPSSALYKYSKAIFGEGVNPEAFVTSELEFKFARENHRKVPVRAVRNISYRSQYTAADQMEFIPDSVVIYGDPARLEAIDAVLTQTISHSDVHGAIHGTVRLVEPSGIRLSDDRVVYSQDVSRYVELRCQVPVEVRGAPSSLKMAVLPGTVEVLSRCVFPLDKTPSPVRFWIDYREFESSRGGVCMIHHGELPSGVLSISIQPEVCECFVLQSSDR